MCTPSRQRESAKWEIPKRYLPEYERFYRGEYRRVVLVHGVALALSRELDESIGDACVIVTASTSANAPEVRAKVLRRFEDREEMQRGFISLSGGEPGTSLSGAIRAA
jgi:hypothetical protein